MNTRAAPVPRDPPLPSPEEARKLLPLLLDIWTAQESTVAKRATLDNMRHIIACAILGAGSIAKGAKK